MKGDDMKAYIKKLTDDMRRSGIVSLILKQLHKLYYLIFTNCINLKYAENLPTVVCKLIKH